MKKSDWQYLLGALILICVIGMVLAGFLLGVAISKDRGVSDSADYVLALHRHQWGSLLLRFSIAFVVLSIIYIILRWSWIKTKISQLFHRGLAGILVLTTAVFLTGVFLFWALSLKAPKSHEYYGEKAGLYAINDQMTLFDVEKATGIPAKNIAEALGLPPGISLNETLRQQAEKYGFDLQKVRDCVFELHREKESLEQKKGQAEETGITKGLEIKIQERESHRGRLQKEPAHRLVRKRPAAVASGILITGRMSLYDLEQITGIPAREIADELGIPPNAPLHGHLGSLRKKYLFSMHEVRDAVTSLMQKNRIIKDDS